MSRLTSLTVTDFRSIRGSITVPLDAPVVLIHGQNGSGKTSLLSAIELALTGAIPSFARADSSYVQHLVHKDADTSAISLSAIGVPDTKASSDIKITRSAISGAPLLAGEPSRFYSERCFLAQSTLGKLLELYEDKDTRRSDSRLTKFVKDLLGLDHLDALIDGLHDAGDVRRFRSSVPAYAETRENIPIFNRNLDRLRTDLSSCAEDERKSLSAVRDALPALDIDAGALKDISVLQTRLNNASEEDALQNIAGLRRQILAVGNQWTSISGGTTIDARAAAERAASATVAALETWRSGPGNALDQALQRASAFFPDQQQAAAHTTQGLHLAAVRAVDTELQRLDGLLKRAAEDDTKLATLSQDIERATARGAILDQQAAALAQDAGQIAKVLSDLVPHIHTDDCPVCGRDFGEISKTGLAAHVSARISELTERAGRLQAVSRERSQTSAALTDAQRQRDALNARRLDPKARDSAKTREAQLKELRQTLSELRAAATEGQKLATEAADASRTLTALQSRDLQRASISEILISLATNLEIDLPTELEAPTNVIARLRSKVEANEAELQARFRSRQAVLSHIRELDLVRARKASLAKDVTELEARIAGMTVRKDAADALIADAKDLAKSAREARTAIVRRVFNEALNAIWRSLFVRLAPEEPFVPAFALPGTVAGAVEAVLETHYRSGGKGGNPRAMLSAGNLNTAALTLFLALHLSVSPTLPWLVIDDPVQSMDEVHIAQFAALLRTLSKAHNRQVIIAVHEKQLFDYLSLELSPAFASDRLITIELSRSADGQTLINYVPVIWEPDTAIAA